MSIREFNTQEELDSEAERIEDLNFKHLELKNAVDEKQLELDKAIDELRDFEQDNKECFAG